MTGDDEAPVFEARDERAGAASRGTPESLFSLRDLLGRKEPGVNERLAGLFTGARGEVESDDPPLPDAAPPPPEGLALPPGTTIGRYVIEGPLAQGGMGAVYRARHKLMGRMAALKVLKPEIAGRAGFRARFLREASVASRFRHPGVVELYDFEDAAGLCYLAMELVEGRSLAAILSRERLDLARTATIFDQLLAALAAAHEGGVIHRDLKPGNIMVGAGDRVKVLDFGTARILESGVSPLTDIDEFVGTPAYAAPEQAIGRAVDERTDLYQVAVILFEVLAGRLPFLAADAWKLLRQHVGEPPPLLSPLRPDLVFGRDLEALLARGLAKEPGLRFQTAREMREAIGEVLAGCCDAARTELGLAARAAGMAGGDPGAPPRRRPQTEDARARALLLCDGVPGLRKLFLVFGQRLAFGRSPDDARRGLRNDVILRVLPCRDGERDPKNLEATLGISNAHGEIDVEGASAWVRDRSSQGLLLDGRPIGRERAAQLGDAFELVLGEGSIALAGQLIRGEVGPPSALEAVMLRRCANAVDHAYALVVGALTIGRGAAAAIDLREPAAAPIAARLSARAGSFHLEVPRGSRVPVTRDGAVLAPGTEVEIAFGARLSVGEATFSFEEARHADFTTE